MASKRRRANLSPLPAPHAIPAQDGVYVKIPISPEQAAALRDVFESFASLVKAGLSANAAIERARRLPARRR